jgi:hypothetical protein
MPQITLFPSTVTVKRFVMTLGAVGETHYSIRRRSDGLFQVYHDDPYVGINQPYEFHDEQWGGLFGSAEAAEKELLRLRPGSDARRASLVIHMGIKRSCILG